GWAIRLWSISTLLLRFPLSPGSIGLDLLISDPNQDPKEVLGIAIRSPTSLEAPHGRRRRSNTAWAHRFEIGVSIEMPDVVSRPRPNGVFFQARFPLRQSDRGGPLEQ